MRERAFLTWNIVLTIDVYIKNYMECEKAFSISFDEVDSCYLQHYLNLFFCDNYDVCLYEFVTVLDKKTETTSFK